MDIETIDLTPYAEGYSDSEGVLESFDGQSDEKKGFRRYDRAIKLLAKLPDGCRNGTAEKLATAMRDYSISKTGVVNAVALVQTIVGISFGGRSDFAGEEVRKVVPRLDCYIQRPNETSRTNRQSLSSPAPANESNSIARTDGYERRIICFESMSYYSSLLGRLRRRVISPLEQICRSVGFRSATKFESLDTNVAFQNIAIKVDIGEPQLF